MASVCWKQNTRKRKGEAEAEKIGEPYLVAKYRTGVMVNGAPQWKQIAVPREHATTKPRAQRWADDFEEKLAHEKKAPTVESRCDPLLVKWAASLSNANAKDDRARTDCYLRPMFGPLLPGEVNLPVIMTWLDELKAGTAPVNYSKTKRGRRVERLSSGSRRALFNLLSRFFSWCVERGFAQLNPCRIVPTGKRPTQAAKSDTPWIRDEKLVRDIMHALPQPVDLMFYLGNRSGIRGPGELCGLRMSDLAFVREGVIRLRFSYNKCLKEDTRKEGKVKWCPAPEDFDTMMGAWVARREAEGAGPEDKLFPMGATEEAMKQRVEGAWDKAMRRGKVYTDASNPAITTMTFYQATRHSFASRNMQDGASLDEVSSALGHSSPSVTRRYYDHFVRKSFSPALRAGVGMAPKGADAAVLPIRTRRPDGAPAEFGATFGATVDKAPSAKKAKTPGTL